VTIDGVPTIAEAAIKKAIKLFAITNAEHQKRLVAQRVVSKAKS